MLLKIRNMMDIKEVLILRFIRFLKKRPLHLQLNLPASGGANKPILNQISNLQTKFINELLEICGKEGLIFYSKTIFSVLI